MHVGRGLALLLTYLLAARADRGFRPGLASCWRRMARVRRRPSCMQLALISSVSAASLELHGPKFRILHVSDAHYHSAQEMCRDTTPSPFLCTHANTTAFLRSAIALEQPHMVAFTGDIIDEASGPRPREGMRDIYSTAIESGLPWAASLGNHEDVVPGMTRDVIYDYVLGLPGRALSAHGPIATSPGNFYVDLSSAGKAVARLVFFDSRNDDRFVNGSTHSITDAQARPRTHLPVEARACTPCTRPAHALHTPSTRARTRLLEPHAAF